VTYDGIRGFLASLEDVGELATIGAPVEIDQELAAVCVHSLRRHGPALLFTRPGGRQARILVNLLASRRRVGLALGCRPSMIQRFWSERVRSPLPPRLVNDGPCQEVVLVGDEVDITRWPVPTWNALDGGPFLTLSCHHTRDPASGIMNVGIYRNQVHGPRLLGLATAPFAHLNLQRQGRSERAFPVAIAIGVDPRVTMAASAPFPFGVDELAMAGALRGRAIDVVRCRTVPLEVPADAEMVIEGTVELDSLLDEGPYGEITGYYGIGVQPRPVIRVTALSHRADPILHLAYQGAPPHETDVLLAIAREAEILGSVSIEGLHAVHVTQGGCGMFHVVVAVEKPYVGFGKIAGFAVLGTPVGRYVKQVIVVDADVDPFDPLAVEWAVATRVQPRRDVDIIESVSGTVVDVSMGPGEGSPGLSSKMIIDATRFDPAAFPPISLPAPKAMAKVAERWSEFGIPDGVDLTSRGGLQTGAESPSG
jgi:UbiD family decarboxylase